MLFRPRKFAHKNIHKRRFFRLSTWGKLNYGNIGLFLIQPLRLNSKQMFRYKLFLKKAARRTDKTLRKVWFYVFPHLPITRKVAGSRMGKGKGKLAGWSTELPAGKPIFELKNLRPGRAVYFTRQLMFRIPARTKILYSKTHYTPLTLKRSKTVTYNVIW